MDAVLALLVELKQEIKKSSKPSEVLIGKCHYSEKCTCQRFVPVYSNNSRCDGCSHKSSYHAFHEPDIKIVLDPTFLNLLNKT